MDREEIGSRAIEFVRRCGIRAGLGFATADQVTALVVAALESQGGGGEPPSRNRWWPSGSS
jgi:hypothetical protein